MSRSKLAKPIDLAKIVRLYPDAQEHGELVTHGIAALLENVDDDTLVSGFASAHVAGEEASAPYRFAEDLYKFEIERRLVERRKARGGEHDTSPIAIPHPLVEVINEAEFGPYQIDVDVLEGVMGALSEDERAKLLTIVPEHTIPERVIPAEVVPRAVIPGNIATIKALVKKYHDSPFGKVAASAITRKFIRFRTIIKPKTGSTARRPA